MSNRKTDNMARKKITIGKIDPREIIRKTRRRFHKPTQVEKDKRKGRGKERQMAKFKFSENEE